MLDNHPREQLRFIIENYGRSIIDDPRRCKGMLKDLAPKHQRETNLLMLALEQKLVAELTQKTHTPIPMHLDLLAQRLHNNVGIQKEFAIWAIESWALALNVMQRPEAQKIVTPKTIVISKSIQTQLLKWLENESLTKTTKQKIGKFTVQGGVAIDTETGLMWLRFAHGQRWENGTVVGDLKKMEWNEGMKLPNTFNRQGYGGHKDWRVPNIDELKTLIKINKNKLIEKNRWVSEKKIDADVFFKDADVFPKNGGQFFWSSSAYTNLDNGAYGAWFVYFENNKVDWSFKWTKGCFRLVR